MKLIALFCLVSTFTALTQGQQESQDNSGQPETLIPDAPLTEDPQQPGEVEIVTQPPRVITDADRNIYEIIKSRGFGYETHRVLTQDGILITLVRIVNPLVKVPGRPVVLQHGLIASGVDFLIGSDGGHINEISDEKTSGNNLGFEAAKKGFDVWLPNSRGNTYSDLPESKFSIIKNKLMRLIDLWQADKTYWEFSIDQHIKYDTPAVIDYILNVTKRDSLGWVGHSQGTLIMFGLLAEQPEYNKKIKPFIALAPVTTLKHIKSPIKYLGRTPFVASFIKSRGGRFLPSNSVVKLLAAGCPSSLRSLCTNILFIIVGYNEQQLNHDRLNVYLTHTPAGTSAWNIVHYTQLTKTGKFAKFDHGSAKKNEELYGSPEPPEYDLSRITNQYIAIFNSINDWLASPEDVQDLKGKLVNAKLIEDHVIPDPKWNHLDFIWGRDANRFVNHPVLRLLDEYVDHGRAGGQQDVDNEVPSGA